jgi:hypothetical protein
MDSLRFPYDLPDLCSQTHNLTQIPSRRLPSTVSPFHYSLILQGQLIFPVRTSQ